MKQQQQGFTCACQPRYTWQNGTCIGELHTWLNASCLRGLHCSAVHLAEWGMH